MQRRLIELDFVRGVAIIAVMAYHYVDPTKLPSVPHGLSFVTRSGWIGVDLFFVLSGYLVAGLLFAEYKVTKDIRFSRFLCRRALKIWPSYYAYLIVQVIVHRHPITSFFIQNVSNLQNYLGSSLEHTWSLAVEEHFYLVLAIIIAIWKWRRYSERWVFNVCVSLCTLILLLRVVLAVTGHQKGITAYSHTRLDSMLFGVLLAWIANFDEIHFRKLLGSKYVLLLFAVTAAIFGIVVPKSSWLMESIGFTILYLGAGALILLMLGHSQTMREWKVFKLVAWVGLYSYTIYLWHLSVREPILGFLGRWHMPRIEWWLAPLLESLAAVCLAFVASRAIEWPVLRLRDRVLPRRKSHPVVALVNSR